MGGLKELLTFPQMMINPLFWRFNHITKPVRTLNSEQRAALQVFRQKLFKQIYRLEKAPCLCGHQGGEIIARRDRYALPVTTILCPACGVMRMDPRLTEMSLTRFYEEDYRAIYGGQLRAADAFFENQIQRGRKAFDIVCAILGASPNSTVFDIGCGAGGMLIPFREVGWNVFGCDIGSEYLERGRQEGLVLKHGDVDTLTEHGPAQLVMLSHVLEHLPNPRKSLMQISQVLAENGYIYLEIPGILNVHNTYGDFIMFLQNAHLYHFNLTTLSYLMAEMGFNLVEGDEYIRALYQKSAAPQIPIVADEARKIKRYLYFAEMTRLSRQSRLFRLAFDLIRRAFGRSRLQDV